MNELDFRLITENTSDVIMRVAYNPANGTLRTNYVSPSSLRVFGWTPEEMHDKGPEHFVAPEDFQTVMEAASRTLAGEEDVRVVFRMRRRSGDYVWVEHINRLIRDPRSGMLGDFVIAMRDVTERHLLEEQLLAMASTDGLTGLANRRAFDQRLHESWRAATEEHCALSVLLIDLDHFKSFNDQYGHLAGDDCLRAVATVLGNTVQFPGSLVARYGGEEFAVILPGFDAIGAYQAADLTRDAVERLGLSHEMNLDGCGRVTISLGAATTFYRDDRAERTPDVLLAEADAALYKAKRKGRNRVEAASLQILTSTSRDAA